MKSNIIIPETLKVGFQNRDDTYTKKLAYVIYYDHKGVLRKEASWNSWRNKDIPDLSLSNVPTSGFVLNKKAGGYSSGWNHRQTYIRVYDPRDFEFEISVFNLLYILENTNSIKGKGLEGEFVYGWDGKELVLLPIGSPDYHEINSFNKILQDKNFVKTKDLIIGATYKTKDNQEWIYMGRFDSKDTKSERVEDGRSNDYWNRPQYKYTYHKISKGKYHFFVREAEYSWGEKYKSLLTLKSLGEKFIDVVSSECVSNYSDLFDWLERQTEYSHRDESKDEWVKFPFQEFENHVNSKKFRDSHWGSEFKLYSSPDKRETIYYDINSKQFYNTGKWIKEKMDYEKIYIGDITKVFNQYSPVYKNEYLENGKIYRRVN
ncbi:hypothetical protein AV545_03595 [Paenibacillus jamilae]|uniref:hypothetical protein n=1 Tax=Paenibacillus jamilae TaxID=114136 RepID=UPI0007AB3649|nr:hypothetical protein [Paenibacillus jamilae]KZE65015.1 hypothetical protein AV545_03595 [Paenibacillus jamilae]